MMVMLAILIVATLFELGLDVIPGLWGSRRFIASVISVGVPFASGGIFAWRPGAASGLLLVVSVFRVFNTLRVAGSQMNEVNLRRATRQTSLWLVGTQLLVAGAWVVDRHLALSDSTWIMLLALVQLFSASVLAASTARRLRRTKPITPKAAYADSELPTVTVAIPARNEDEQLEACLQSVIASDYPKLEVLVFDDCSQDRTSQIIRGFAHDGVRFISGKEPTPNWLAKNQAYEQLAQEASGELILFCGVDVRFAPHSVRQLVTLLKRRRKTMLSLLPINERPGFSIAQTMRYYWELALPRRMFNRPPVMSSFWLIEARALKAAGGFAAVSRSITPEAHFARYAIEGDKYSFMRSTPHLGVASVKGVPEQRETAVRTRYPQLHRRPELVLAVVAAELVLLFAPFVLVIVGLWGVLGMAPEIIFATTCLVLAVTYHRVTSTTSPKNRWGVSPLFPVAVLVDIILLHYSMWKYEFSTVEWKGRNVCIPVMHTYSHLPPTK